MDAKPERYIWLTELTDVSLTAKRQLPPLMFQGSVRANLALVNNVAYVRQASAAWRKWATESGRQSTLLFNWVSVFNFNQNSDAHLFTLDVAEDGPHAMMLVQDKKILSCDAAQRGPLPYVAFLEVAPWNHPDAQQRLLTGLGPIMLRAASDFSRQQGCGGRIGLHALAAAESFYRRERFAQIDCPNEFNELYFELDDEGASALLSG